MQQSERGYIVDLNAADAFTLGATLVLPHAEPYEFDVLGYDVPYTDPVLVLRRDGGSRTVELR